MRVKFDESLKISGPYGDMDAKFQPCQDDEAPNNLLIMAHGFRGSMEGGGRAADPSCTAGRRIFRRWRRCL